VRLEVPKIRIKKRVVIVVGARPNFMKIAPLMCELDKYKSCFEVLLVHTGQHYDFEMSEIFFRDLKVPKPDIYLNIGSASHAVQTAKIMMAFERVAVREKPDLIVVVGDVNSTLACALVASKLNIKVVHVEAGLRSFDRTMPEEINRTVTDSLSDYLFVSERSGLKNLKTEGVNSDKVYFVGNIMIDTLLANLPIINKSDILNEYGLAKHEYCVMTLHRPSNVDSPATLSELLDVLSAVSNKVKIIYPIHPRTKNMMRKHNFANKFKKLNNLLVVEPLGYINFIKLIKESRFVITDSGGIQEETTFLAVPCLTMRTNTERPVTIEEGTNYLVGRNKTKVLRCIKDILNGKSKKGSIPELWDGKTAKRIVKILSTN
jgi:UDP-N-acetylglucosamine 2-epimerase (non-hydrolysing)